MKGTEQLYTIPLGKAYNYKRSKRAIRAVDMLRNFVLRHAKTQEAIISMKTNEHLWSRSMQKPPRRIKVKVVKKEDKAYVYLPDEKIEEPKKEEKKKEEKKEEKKPEKKETEPKPEKTETKKEEKPKEPKKEEKKETEKKPVEKK